MSRAEQAQAADADRAGGRTIAIEIADNDYMAAIGHGIRQQCDRRIHPEQIGRQQLRESGLGLLEVDGPACRIQTREQPRKPFRPIVGSGRRAADQPRFRLHAAIDGNGRRQKRQR